MTTIAWSLPRRIRLVVLLASSALALSSCSGTLDAHDADPARTIAHAYGETAIPDSVERVVVIGGSAQDTVAALGVLPVAVPSEYGTADGYTPWFREYVTQKLGKELPPTIEANKDGAYDAEEILGYAPDLILAPYSGITETEYQRLSEVAPTVAFEEKAWTYGSWADMTTRVGLALGREHEAEELIVKTEQKIEEQAAVHPDLAGRSFIFGEWVEDGSSELAVYSPDDPRSTLMRGFGLVDAPSVKAAIPDFGVEYVGAVSLERLDELTADIYIGWSNSAGKIAATLSHPLMSRWEPIATGHYLYVEEPEMLMAITVPTALSVPWALDQGLLDDISGAVAGQAVLRTRG